MSTLHRVDIGCWRCAGSSLQPPTATGSGDKKMTNTLLDLVDLDKPCTGWFQSSDAILLSRLGLEKA